MSIKQGDVEHALESHGFERTNKTDRAVEYRSRSNRQYLYFRTTIGMTDYIRVVIHPALDVTKLLAIRGVVQSPRSNLQHGDHMRKFPRRLNKGKKPVHFGKPLNIDTASTIPAFSAVFHTL